jgi:K+/H+ antiporter YhaU regulatory subunit KhtT
MAGGLQEMIPKPIYEIDHMIVVGTKDQLEKENSFLKVESSENCVERTKIAQFDVLIFCIRSDKNFVGKLLIDLDLRGKYVVNVAYVETILISLIYSQTWN